MRKNLAERGADVDQLTDADLNNLATLQGERFRDNAPTTAAQASEIILNAILENRWRILVGDDAAVIDELVREDPESAYETEFLQRIVDRGHLEFFNMR